MATRAESISRIRNVLKSVKEDPFMTDRFIFSMIMKYAKMIIRRQDNEGKIMNFQSLFQFIPCVELIDVDKVNACCTGIKTGCTIKRSKERLPKFLEGSFGPIIRTVATLDMSDQLFSIQPGIYSVISNGTSFKYNHNNYYWLLDGYIFIPNVEWEGVYIEGIFEENIAPYVCDSTPEEICIPAQELPLNIPDYLLAEIEQMALKEMLTTGQIPSDGADDAQNILR